jgi:putative NADPH-quinone reductase
MKKSLVIINGHPDPEPKRLSGSLCGAYADAARKAGHIVRIINLSQLDYSFLRSKHDWEHEDVPDVLCDAQKALIEADHWVVIYPLWMGTMPAKLSAFFEQVLRPGLLPSDHEPGSSWMPSLDEKSARIIVTMAMPGAVYKAWFRAHSLKSFERNMLKFIGLDPVKHTVVGNVYNKSDRAMEKVFKKVRALGRDAR